MARTTPEQNKALVLEALETLFNKRDYDHGLILAEGDYIIVHGRFSGAGRPAAWVAADVVRIENGALAEHWDVLQDEATRAEFEERIAHVRRPLSRMTQTGV